MDSPCIASCKLNSDKICIGCYRHIEEIVDWNKRTEAEQMQIIAITQSEWQQAKAKLALQRKIRLE
jgi:predicted Fe-S protein YdhL (DUF1289 family)